jgi:hypothetical protein
MANKNDKGKRKSITVDVKFQGQQKGQELPPSRAYLFESRRLTTLRWKDLTKCKPARPLQNLLNKIRATIGWWPSPSSAAAFTLNRISPQMLRC